MCSRAAKYPGKFTRESRQSNQITAVTEERETFGRDLRKPEQYLHCLLWRRGGNEWIQHRCNQAILRPRLPLPYNRSFSASPGAYANELLLWLFGIRFALQFNDSRCFATKGVSDEN